MTDTAIREGLAALGIDQQSYQLLALLPLIQVAWADGRIQSAERKIILRVAKENGYVEGEASRTLESWLRNRPTEEFFDRARLLLVAMVKAKGNSFSTQLPIETLTDLVDVCEEIARSAGGFFGIFPMDVREQAAIKEIMDTIHLPPPVTLDIASWGDLRSS